MLHFVTIDLDGANNTVLNGEAIWSINELEAGFGCPAGFTIAFKTPARNQGGMADGHARDASFDLDAAAEFTQDLVAACFDGGLHARCAARMRPFLYKTMARVNCPAAAPKAEKKRRDTCWLLPRSLARWHTLAISNSTGRVFRGQRYDGTSVPHSICPKGQA